MSFFLLSWGKVILERMSFGLWIVSYFVTFKVQATAVKLQSVATPVLHESPMPAPATGSDGLTLWLRVLQSRVRSCATAPTVPERGSAKIAPRSKGVELGKGRARRAHWGPPSSAAAAARLRFFGAKRRR